MKLLITPEEIAALLPAGNTDAIAIPETTIIAAQSRYIRPVIGEELYAAIESGSHKEFVGQLLKPAAALYSYYLAIPSIAFRSGNLGVVRFKSDYYSPADHESLTRLRKAVRSEADAAMQIVVEHLESNPLLFPEYDRSKNIRHRTSILGGVVL